MGHGPEKRRNSRSSLADRLMLRLSAGRRVDGLWIGTFLEKEHELVLRRVEEALRLIKQHDPRRYDRLTCDLERVWVRLLPQALGSYNHSIHACQLDTRYVLDETSRPELIASTIVHEATHARLSRCGVGYEEAQRARVEAVCHRRELAFAARLPNGEQVREEAESRLLRCGDDKHWTNVAVSERHVGGVIHDLRQFGASDWLVRFLVRTVPALRGLYGVLARFIREGDFHRAVVEFNEAIRPVPNLANAFADCGLAWHAEGDLDRAIADYNEALRLNPLLARVYNDRGAAWHNKGDLDRAIADFTEAIRLDPKLAIVYRDRGVAWHNKGDLDRAIADFTEAIRLDPKLAIVYRDRGVAWHNKGDLDRAIADFTEAIRLEPQFAEAYTNRGLAWRDTGDFDRASVDFNRAIWLDPKDARTKVAIEELTRIKPQ
jgi:Flp pilus assembly protein TadD